MKRFSESFVLLTAKNMENEWGLPHVSDLEIHGLYGQKIPLPIEKENAAGTVWLDPYYAAYRLRGGRVRYVYLTMNHIAEELRSYRLASLLRKRKIELPPDIARQFKKAMNAMRASGLTVWMETEDYRKRRTCGRVDS